jgi:hypothetical protein
MGPSRPAAIAVLVGSLASVGCLNTEPQKEPLVLGSDARTRLTAPADPASPKSAKVPAFDPTATGGTGLSKDNSFNRTTPGPGTGTRTGDFASRLPDPQVGLPPAVTAPSREGVSYGDQMPDQGRTAMTPRAAPPAAPVAPAPPAEPGPFGPPRLDPPTSEPPVRPVTFKDPEPPAPPAPIRPVPPTESAPLPALPMTAPVAPSGPLPPIAPVAPGVGPNEPLPAAPAPPAFVPSPTVLPPTGLGDAPKLPPPPPIRPQ